VGTGGGGTGGTAPQTQADCLVGWQGSSCDTCTGADAPDAGASCAEVLDCFAANHCGPASCHYCEAPDAGVSDRAVELERQVFACKCGAL